MNEKDLELIAYARESLTSLLLIFKMAEASIENDAIEKIWDLYPLFRVVKNLGEKALDNLWQIEDSCH